MNAPTHAAIRLRRLAPIVRQWREACTSPMCEAHGPDDTAVSVTERADGYIHRHCFRCDAYSKTTNPASRGKPVMAPYSDGLAPWAASLYETAQELLAERRGVHRLIANVPLHYLLARACVIPPAGSHLRGHGQVRHSDTHTGPALVALVTDSVTGEPISLHRTWVNADGSKAAVDPPRKLAAGHRKKGGVIRLYPLQGDTLVIAEGIETALSIAHKYPDYPVWSCIDAGNISGFPVLRGVKHLIIAADNDKPGLNVARLCAARWRQKGRKVTVRVPPEPHNDWNDFLRAALAVKGKS